MKNDNLSSILADLAENAAPSAQIDLWPAMKKHLETSDWQPNQGESTMKQSKARIPMLLRAFLVVLVLIAAFSVLLVTPQGYAFAQKMFRFFSITNEKSFVIPTDQVFSVPETPTPVPTYVLPLQSFKDVTQSEPTKPTDLSCNTPVSQSGYYCQIKAVEALSGFDVKEFLYDPKGTEFSKVTYDAGANQVTMEFEVSTGGGSLYLRQGMDEFVPSDDEWSKVPTDSVEQVTVNGKYAEIVSGTFVVYPNAASAVWKPGGQLSLVWRDENRWFVLEKWGDPYPIEWITKEELVKLAEGLVDERPLDAAPPRDPENLKSVTDAEKLAGFDVLAPTFLPQGYELKRAIWVYESVRLFYGPKSSQGSTLAIFMGPVENHQVGPCFECPAGTDEVVQVGPWQGWYWRGIYHTGPSIEGQPTTTPVWQADARNWVMAWNTDHLWISLSFSPPDNGEVITRDILIAIAESMK